MEYQINILSNDEFDRLPYKNINDSLGFADRKNRVAFVRHTGVDDLNKYLVDHELEELVSSESAHEDENGLRHKKLRQAVGNIAPFAGPLFGQALGGSAGAGIGGAIGGGLKGGIGGEKKSFGRGAIGAGLGGVGGYAGSKLTGGFGIPGKTAGGQGIFGRIGTGVKSGFGIPSAFSKFTGGGGSPQMLTGSASPGAKNIAGQYINLPLTGGAAGASAFGPQTGGATGAPGAPSGGSPLSQLFSGKGLLGMGLKGIGLGSKYPSVPEVPSSIADLQAQIQGGGSDLGRLAQQTLTEQLNTPYEELSADEEEAILRQSRQQREDRLDAVRDLYRNLRPGTDPSSDSAFRRDINEINEEFDRVEQDLLTQSRRSTRDEYNARIASNVQQSLGASSQDMLMLSQLAQLDVDRISAQLNIDLQAASDFKNTFMNLGDIFLNQAVGYQNPFEQFAGMFS